MNRFNKEVFCVGFSRTPIGKMAGGLASLTASRLGASAISGAIKNSGVPLELIEEAYMGNVVSAGVGQAPCRQAVIYAGLPLATSCTTVNKVCASGMKSAMLASMSIASGYRGVCIAGGMESMSNIPYYLPGARTGYRLGNNTVVDGLIHDGLWDLYNNQHMGNCGELCASTYGITRKDQDDFAIRSYERAANAWKAGHFDWEVSPVSIPSKRKGGDATLVSIDEEFTNIQLDKVPSLKSAFMKDGTITAANASKLSDGAAAMVLVSGEMVEKLGLKPLFKIIGYGDAERDPVEFTTAPADAVPKALANASRSMSLSDVQYHEINEAFAVVPMACARLLDLDLERVNVHGGAIALGHPIGCSGARILGTLYSVLKANDATIGCASICNGGGGASAVIIERMN
jgi:acetyl-CoA C-acetyltransferase